MHASVWLRTTTVEHVVTTAPVQAHLEHAAALTAGAGERELQRTVEQEVQRWAAVAFIWRPPKRALDHRSPFQAMQAWRNPCPNLGEVLGISNLSRPCSRIA
ncbi:MAG: hypothetical protein J0L58_17475 [Burkholderiales bacterium]|nr:hypothetical protein [Burkholderiales bacterium]